MQTPALDFTKEKADRPFVRIDHVDYDVRLSDDLTIPQIHEIDRLMPRIVPLNRKLELGTIEEQEAEELSALLKRCVEIALSAPKTVVEGLGDVQRVQVFELFMRLLSGSDLAARAKELQRMMAANPSPGRTSSPASSGSTAARPKTGRERRSAR
jgi:hypothetical protein